MKLTKSIPQFLPMHRRKIRLYHNGIDKLCTNCFEHHTRRQCRNQKKKWIEYVRDFMMDHPDLTEEYYGRWWDVVDVEYPGYFDNAQDAPNEQAQAAPTRFAEPRSTLPKPNRDPRLNRDLRQQQTTQTQQQTQQRMQQENQMNQTFDRQREMSRLLANGLTLTDARRYLSSMEEMETLNARMQVNNSEDRFSFLDEAAGVQRQRQNQHQQQHGGTQRSERGSSRGRGLQQPRQQ